MKTINIIFLGMMLCTSISAVAYSADTAIQKNIEVSPVEDLMREHGVLRRIMLIYEEILKRLDKNADLQPQAIADSANIVRDFIENYHEKLEEDYIFPRFEKAGKLADLTKILREQHKVGRRLTDDIIKFSTAESLKNNETRKELAKDLRLFIRMYRPHAAREDTVLFPALHTIVSAKDYDLMGDQFEDRETALFGENGFGKTVDKVRDIEKILGIENLAEVTPQ